MSARIKRVEGADLMRFTPPEVQSVDFDCVLPPHARTELLRHRSAQSIEPSVPAIVKSKLPRWLKSFLTFAAIIMTPIAMVAVLVGIIAALGGLKNRPSPEMQRIASAALHKIGSGQPAVQTPAVSPWSAVAAYCTSGRALALTQPTPAVEVRRATPAVMRGELASLPVRRATLLHLPN
jgi:hypothetical protein